MAGNTFIKFAGVAKGESTQAGHDGAEGWIEIGDWSWDIEAEASNLKGQGAAVGKPTPGVLSFSHYFDLASPVILKKIVSGTHFDEVTIEMLKSVGDQSGKPQTYFQLKAKQAFITKVSTKGGEDGSVSQDVEMVFKEVVVSYKAQLNDGALEKAAIPFAWNIPLMNNSTTIKGM
jgi:type VI secretion system secreted protein Hcp